MHTLPNNDYFQSYQTTMTNCRTYHKPSNLLSIVNGYTFWSDFCKKQYGNLVLFMKNFS